MSNLEKLEFATLDISGKNYLSWILDAEIHLDAMGLGDAIKERNKSFEQLICSYENNIVNRDFTNIMNLFHTFVLLDKAIKLLMKNHEIHLICSIPRSECSNKYYEFISCLCMVEQSNELLIETHVILSQKLTNKNEFLVWHDRLGHPRYIMMQKKVENSCGHPLKSQKLLQSNDFSCTACYQGKLIIRPLPEKIRNESISFLERIQCDICGPIHPPCGSFRYFMVLIDVSTRWSHICLLSTRNQTFAKLLAQLIKLKAHFPDYPIKKICLHNVGEFTSHAFNEYCMSIGMKLNIQ